MVYFGLVPNNLAVLLFFLTITEHLSQELFRIYIAIEKVTLANTLFFLRTGTWSWAISLYLIFIGNSNVTLINILIIWLLFSFISVIIGIIFIPNIKSFNKEKIDKKIIIQGTKVALLMFVSTIFLKITEYSDRYFINYFLGKKELGIYAFYYQISNIINVVIFTLYISYAYPKILKSVYNSDLAELKKEKKKLTNNTLIIILIALFLSFTILPYILDIVGKSELTKNIGIVYILIFASLFFNLSFSSHFVLVAEEKEKLILKASVAACFFNLLLNIILLPILGVYGSAVTLLISCFALFIIKFRYEKNITSKWKK
jgi:O-antigen/teichoic acid export membrane protein